MRDNHEELPEMLNAFEECGKYFGLVQFGRGAEEKRFRIGISREGYLAFRRALQLRPFDQMAGANYRYFFVPAVRRLNGDRVMMTVRVEQNQDGKNLEVEAPRDVVANFMWFCELDDWSKAKHLEVTD